MTDPAEMPGPDDPGGGGKGGGPGQIRIPPKEIPQELPVSSRGALRRRSSRFETG